MCSVCGAGRVVCLQQGGWDLRSMRDDDAGRNTIKLGFISGQRKNGRVEEGHHLCRKGERRQDDFQPAAESFCRSFFSWQLLNVWKMRGADATPLPEERFHFVVTCCAQATSLHHAHIQNYKYPRQEQRVLDDGGKNSSRHRWTVAWDVGRAWSSGTLRSPPVSQHILMMRVKPAQS